jgi:hypothetical protein
VRELAARAYFASCLIFGRLLRAGRYSRVAIVDANGRREVHKRRAFFAPALIWLGDLLVRLLDTGMHVLPQREWGARERELYERLYAATVRATPDRILILPVLAGDTLAALLERRTLGDATRVQAIGFAVRALADFHARGFTHGDAMAENVLVDLEGGVARWFDFETVHHSSRPMVWRRADDVRALLATCLTRTAPEKLAPTLTFILDTYGDDGVTPSLAAMFDPVVRRPLAFHLGQAPLDYRRFREIARLLQARLHGCGVGD